MHIVQSGELISNFLFSFVLIWLSDILRGFHVRRSGLLPSQKGKVCGHCIQRQVYAFSSVWKVVLLVKGSEMRSLIQGITETLKGKVDVLTLSVQHKRSDKKGIATPGLGENM